MILLYAPAWWMRLALPCTPFTYEDCLTFIQDRLGRKKGVTLPAELAAPPAPKPAKAAPVKAQQLSMADIPPAAEPPAPSPEAEKPEDFVPLADVLEEIKGQESKSE